MRGDRLRIMDATVVPDHCLPEHRNPRVFWVDLELVWGIVPERLGPLNQALREILEAIPE